MSVRQRKSVALDFRSQQWVHPDVCYCFFFLSFLPFFWGTGTNQIKVSARVCCWLAGFTVIMCYRKKKGGGGNCFRAPRVTNAPAEWWWFAYVDRKWAAGFRMITVIMPRRRLYCLLVRVFNFNYSSTCDYSFENIEKYDIFSIQNNFWCEM